MQVVFLAFITVEHKNVNQWSTRSQSACKNEGEKDQEGEKMVGVNS